MIRIDFGLVVLTLYRAEGSGVKVEGFKAQAACGPNLCMDAAEMLCTSFVHESKTGLAV